MVYEPDKEGEKQNGSTTRRVLLREHGIHTAGALIAAYEKSRGRNAEDLALFEKILPGTDRSHIRGLVDALSNNPNLELVQRWRQ